VAPGYPTDRRSRHLKPNGSAPADDAADAREPEMDGISSHGQIQPLTAQIRKARRRIEADEATLGEEEREGGGRLPRGRGEGIERGRRRRDRRGRCPVGSGAAPALASALNGRASGWFV
jgi:hypothetical protein